MRLAVVCSVMLAALGCGERVSSRPPAAPPPPAVEPAPPPPAGVSELPALSEAALMTHVDYLTSDALAGRYGGSEGERLAGDYIASVLAGSDIGPFPSSDRFHTFDPRGGWWDSASDESRNVLGYLTGSNRPPMDDVVVVGAHYDHVGRRGEDIYRGADDNASGVAVLLEVARALASRRPELGRSVAIVFFGAEELGLLGARAFVGEPPPRDGVAVTPPFMSADRIAVMVNLDMVGRPLIDHIAASIPLRALAIDAERSLGVIGLQNRPAMRQLVDQAFEPEGIRVLGTEDLPGVLSSFVETMSDGRGDSFPFERVGVPALFFSNGSHADYHEPSDEAHRLRPDLMAARGRAIARLVVLLANAPESALPRSSGSPFAVDPAPR
jgi:hypothetical protein